MCQKTHRFFRKSLICCVPRSHFSGKAWEARHIHEGRGQPLSTVEDYFVVLLLIHRYIYLCVSVTGLRRSRNSSCMRRPRARLHHLARKPPFSSRRGDSTSVVLLPDCLIAYCICKICRCRTGRCVRCRREEGVLST